jgi:surface-anchored protein
MKKGAILLVSLAALAGARAEDIRVLVSNVAGTPNPAIGSGYVLRPAPHVDLNVVWSAGNRNFTGGFRTDEGPGTTPTQFGPEDAIAYLPATGQRQRTSIAAQYDFQGALGDTYWVFPSSATASNNAYTLYVGLTAYGVPRDGTFTNDRVTWTVDSVENLTTPSATSFYGYSVSAGTVNMQLTTAPSYPGAQMTMLADGHTHLNLLFKAAGMYRVTLRVRGTLTATGEEISNLLPVYFGVEEWQIPSAAVPAIALSGDLAYGSVTIGQTATRSLTISNSGNAPLNVGSIDYPAGFSGNWPGGSIAAGSSTDVTVTFTPTAAQSYGGDITVNSDAASGTNTISASGHGTAATVSYTAWRDTQFSPAQAADPLVSGPGADPDGDGFANLEEFAFGGDPLVPDASLIEPHLERDGNSWILTVRQRTDAAGLTITPVATASLQAGLADWRADLLAPHGPPRSVAAGVDEFAYLLQGGLNDRAFLRVRTELATP